MPVRVIEETVEKDVAFLEDVDVKFVSLVRHGANQMPFRVLKSEKTEGGDQDMMVVQSILVSKHVDPSALPETEGLEWLSEAKMDRGREYESYRKFDQTDLDAFDDSTLKMVKLHDDGVWALAGVLKEAAKTERVLTLNSAQAVAANKMPVPPLDEPVPPTTAAAVTSFRDLFYSELDSMIAVLTGALNQSGGDMKKRKSTVLNALDAFRAFLSFGLDALGSESAKMEARDPVAKEPKEVEKMELFKTKEEFAESVTAILTETLPGLIDEKVSEKVEALKAALQEEKAAKTEPAPAAEPTAAKSDDDPMEKITAAVAKLTERVDEIALKWDNGLATQPAGNRTDEAATSKSDKTETKRSVFSGLLVPAPQE
jgi:hypothetical protein